MSLTRITKFEQGYDCIRFQCVTDSKDCIPGGGSHGRHGLGIRFVVKGGKGAVQFVLSTGWTPQHIPKDTIGYRNIKLSDGHGPMATDLGIHSRLPMYEGQGSMSECEYCDGAECYYDGSGLNANDAFYALLNGGDDGLWAFLESYYQTAFEDAEYPTPCEYKKAPR